MVFVAQNSSPPYPIVGLFSLDAETIQKARLNYQRLLRELEGYLVNDNWDENTQAIQVISVKPYQNVDLPVNDLFSTEELLLP